MLDIYSLNIISDSRFFATIVLNLKSPVKFTN